MYHHYFGLQEPAFAIAVNPRYLYMSEQHREALAHLLFGLQGGGFVQLTGEVGTGKTTIIRSLLEQLPSDTDIAVVLNPMASVPELLSTICDEIGARYIADDLTIKNLTDALYNTLLDNHQNGRKTVLLIDEAQSLSAEALEQIRLLTNLETHTEKLLNIILVGQPELCDLLAQPSLRQLAQRITARFHLNPLTPEETAAYIRHRLQVAGLPNGTTLIPEDILSEVHRFSGGIPRLINIICERMLLGAYGQSRTTIDRTLFLQARREITGERSDTTPSAPAKTADAAAPEPEPSAPTKPAPAVLQRLSYPKWLPTALAGVVGLILGALVFGGLTGDDEPSVADFTPTQHAAPLPETPKLSADAIPSPGLNSATAAATAAETEQPSEASIERFVWPPSLEGAQRELAEELALNVPSTGRPCTEPPAAGHACRQRELTTWNDLMELDRPGVLTLITPERKLAYVPLLGLNERQALTLLDGQLKAVAWSDLAGLWTGEFHHFWFRPEGFDGGLTPGARGPEVRWLAEQFAELDGESQPLTRDRYNLALQARVEIFQRSQDLTPDGLFGENTLNELARHIGLDPGLLPVEEGR